jgi:hypothetical protein
MNPDQLLANCTESLSRLAEWCADTSLAGLGSQCDEIVLSALRQVEDGARLLGAAQVHLAAVVEERSAYGGLSDGLAFQYGHSRASHFIESVTRVSQAEAKQRVRIGKHIRSRTSLTGEPLPPLYPDVATAVELGQMSVPVAERIIRGLDQARRYHIPSENEQPGEFDDNLRAAEESLVEQATREPLDSVAVQVLAWRDALDPDGAPMRDEEIKARRGLVRGKERNGVTYWEWRTTTELTAMLDGMIAEANAANSPRFMPTDEYNELARRGLLLTNPAETATIFSNSSDDGAQKSTAAPGEPVPNSDTGGVDCDEYGVVTHIYDQRTLEQRDSDVLEGFLRAGIRASADEMGGIKPIVEVTAVATLADLHAGRGVGYIDGITEPVSIEYIKELACGTGYRLVIQGDHGEILWRGKEPRLFNASQKKAVVIRDGGKCAAGGCHKPARQCDVHHVEFHSDGGPTDVDNAILFCPEHHHMMHKSPFKIRMHNGRPQILAPRWLNPSLTWENIGRARHRNPRAGNTRT